VELLSILDLALELEPELVLRLRLASSAQSVKQNVVLPCAVLRLARRSLRVRELRAQAESPLVD